MTLEWDQTEEGSVVSGHDPRTDAPARPERGPDRGPNHGDRDVTGSEGPPMRVFVHLPHDFDAAGWHEKWNRGEIVGVNEPYPYGYHLAEQMGCRVRFSVGHRESRVGRLGRLAVRALLGFDLVHSWRNRRGIRSADVVWTHTENHSLGVSAVLGRVPAARRPATLMQSVWLIDRWPRTPRWRRALFRRLLSRVDLLTFHSRLNRDAAELMFPGVRCELVRFGIRVDEVMPPAPRPVASPVRVLAVGSDEDRDWRTALAAVADRPDIELTIASRTFPASLELPANVTRQHARSNEQLTAWYRAADVVLVALRSNLHASGLTVLQEAAVFGLPVVCTDVGGLDDYFGRDDLVWVPEGDAAAITSAILALGADPDRRRRLATRAQSRLGEDGIGSRAYIRRQVELSRSILARRAV